MPLGAPAGPCPDHGLLCLYAARLRPRAAKPQSGRRAGEAGLDLVQKLITHATEATEAIWSWSGTCLTSVCQDMLDMGLVRVPCARRLRASRGVEAGIGSGRLVGRRAAVSGGPGCPGRWGRE